MPDVTVLSLGAGVQSTTLYLWSIDGKLHIDAAVFADTGDEPTPVYEHLHWLESLKGPPILRRSLGVHLSATLVAGMNVSGGRFVSIPAHTSGTNGHGIQRRQCTKEFKLTVIERAIRRDVLGCKPGRPIPADSTVTQLIGFSADEASRAKRNEMLDRPRGWTVRFPLIESGWSREDCQRYLREKVPHVVPRSACVFCPFRSNAEWRWLKENDTKGWDRAVRVDAALREEASVCTNGMVDAMYVHRSCKPLSEVAITTEETMPLFFMDCEGGCAT